MRSFTIALFVGASTLAAAGAAAAECPPSLFTAAAAQGDAEQVGLCVTESADINAGNADGVTPLMAAAARGHAPIVATLLEAGASVDAATDDGLTALMFASAWGRRPIVGTLVDAGANVALQDADGFTAIDWARASLYMTGDISVVVTQYLQNADTAPEPGARRNVLREEEAPDLRALINRAEAGEP